MLYRVLGATAAVVLATTGAASAQTPVTMCDDVPATITGTPGADVLVGTSGDDVIVALGGNDRIDGGAGDDLICSGGTGEADDDIVQGGPGADTIDTGPGADRVGGGAQRDYVVSGDGNDIIRGGGADDYLSAGSGNDVLDGEADADYLDAGDGDDTLLSTAGGADYLSGGTGTDTIVGGPDTSYVSAGEGTDHIDSPAGHLDAGEGADVVSAGSQVSFVAGGEGDDTIEALGGYVQGDAGADTLTALGPGGQFLDGGAGADRVYAGPAGDTLAGGEDSDLLVGGSADDTLLGGDGDDELQGRDGGDVLGGDAGADVLVGGNGADVFDGGSGRDVMRAVDGQADVWFRCGLIFEDDRLLVDAVEDAATDRIGCDVVRPRPPKPTPPAPPEVGSRYVALGDSFSSGEGTWTYDDLACHRGDRAWPRRLGRGWLGMRDAAIDHRACSGAESHHLTNPWYLRSQEPQIHHNPQAKTQLVTLTFGGNDIGFARLLADARESPNDLWGPGADRKNVDRRVNVELSGLDASLRMRYAELRRIYPNARIVHVGYPRLLPPNDTATHRCAWLGKKEHHLGNSILERLNRRIRDTAESSPYDIEFADVTNAMSGRELCTRNPIINDLAIELEDIPGVYGTGTTERGHPDNEGQKRYAQAVAAALGYSPSTQAQASEDG